MIPPAPPHLSGPLAIWRLDQDRHAATWDSGEGAFLVGGRWNSAGVRAVYTSLDPSTAILEVAVHKGFRVLDTVAHILTKATLSDPSVVRVVTIADIPNPNWLLPGIPSAGQQSFGDALLQKYPVIALPSVVSTHSWNLIFDPAAAKGLYGGVAQEPFALDTRLHPPAR